MNVERGSPNQRSLDTAEADQHADSTTHLEPDPEQADEPQCDDQTP